VGNNAAVSLIAGIDASTQSTTVVLRRLDDGALVGTASARHPATTPPCSEQDPVAWWTALREAVAALGAHTGEVVALSVAGQQHGMVALGAADEVLHPAKLWNDTESAPDADELVTALGAQVWADTWGSVPVAAFTITKLAWLKRTQPDAFARLERIALPHDWLTLRLTGHHVTDRGDASGTGWWSPIGERYDTRSLAVVDSDLEWERMLARVLEPTEAAGTLAAVVAAELGLPAGCVVGPGTGDNMAAALGLGLRSGDVAISLGTSGTVYGVSATPTADPTGAVAGFASADGQFLPLVCTLNATKVTDAMARLLGVDLAALGELAARSTVGADGVVLIPYLDGERTPNRPEATGLLTGFRSEVTREQLARAAFEGVACGLLDGLDALGAAGASLDGNLLLIGGGARSPAYRQAFADLSGRSITVPDVEEAVATGAAVQAAAVAEGSTIDEVIDRWNLNSAATVVQPSPVADAASIRAAYAAARDLGI
jgi:xylulokinase